MMPRSGDPEVFSDQEEGRRQLPPQVRGFLEAIDAACKEYGIPGYTVLVMAPDLMTASVGGYSDVACNLLAQANMQMADKVKELIRLENAEYRQKQ